jgi:hypothetical protein
MPYETVMIEACAKAVLAFDNGKFEEHHVKDVLACREMIHAYICELATNDVLIPSLVNAMHDIHPQTPYGVDLLIRDLADICRTLRRLTEGKRRSDTKKIFYARIFLQALQAELRSPS